VPGPEAEYELIPTPAPVPSPSVHVPVEIPNPEPSVVDPAGPIAPILPPQGDVIARLVALADRLSAAVEMLRSEVAAIKTDADIAREEAEGLRSSLAVLEGIVMRELVEKASMEKKAVGKKKKEQKVTSTIQGDVLSRQNRYSRKSSRRGAMPEDDSSWSTTRRLPRKKKRTRPPPFPTLGAPESLVLRSR
jgi:hypothetical protein